MSEQFTFGGDIVWRPGTKYAGHAKGFIATRLYFEENYGGVP